MIKIKIIGIGLAALCLLNCCTTYQQKETTQEQVIGDTTFTLPIQDDKPDSNLILAGKSQCTWSELKSISKEGETVKVRSKYSGHNLEPCCWKPEVIVQYIFDCSLFPLGTYIYTSQELEEVNEIILNVKSNTDNEPHNLEFLFSRDEWELWQRDRSLKSKIQIYENLRVKADGKRMIFDAEEAADVE